MRALCLAAVALVACVGWLAICAAGGLWLLGIL